MKVLSSLLVVALLFGAPPVWATMGGPPTVGTINVTGDGFEALATNFVGPGQVYFLEVNYDGISPLTINTRNTTAAIDTEIGLYNAAGVLVASNDDIVFPGNLLSELRLDSLTAGQYFLGVGLFNTVYNPNFVVTSNSTASGNVVVGVFTDTFPVLEGIVNVDLNYNFNGIVHADEPSNPVNNPDHPNGFRSISDRALDFRMGVPSHPTLDRYSLVASGSVLDIVHLGNRNTVSGGVWAFDPAPDLDGIGIQPNWLPNPNQSGRQTSNLSSDVMLFQNSQVTVLFQISNGGGSFEVVVGLSNGSEVIRTVSGPDWFGPFNGQPSIGTFAGAFGTDFGFMDPLGENTLLITEAIIDLGAFNGLMAESLAFQNGSNPNAGIAILAANFAGSEGDCLVGDVNGDGIISLLDIAPFVDVLTSGAVQCEADTNFDGIVSLLDVAPFVDLLVP